MKWTTESMLVELNESGLLIIAPPDNFKGPETLKHAEENIALFRKAMSDKVKGIMAFLPPHYVNTAATRYYRNNAPNVPIALIGDSFFKKMIGNFLLKIINTKRPVKLFTDEPEAWEWLKEEVTSQ